MNSKVTAYTYMTKALGHPPTPAQVRGLAWRALRLMGQNPHYDTFNANQKLPLAVLIQAETQRAAGIKSVLGEQPERKRCGLAPDGPTEKAPVVDLETRARLRAQEREAAVMAARQEAARQEAARKVLGLSSDSQA